MNCELNEPPKNLSIEDQLERFSKRGIIFPKKSEPSYRKDLMKIQEIGYYKLKEFTYPFAYNVNGKLRYHNLAFSDLLHRYYLDKQLRMYILSVTEDLEVSLNSNISDILGNKYNAFGYLNFNNWTDHTLPHKKIIREQHYLINYIKKNLQKNIIFKDLSLRKNCNENGLPSVWLVANIITFGITTYMVNCMSSRNKRLLSSRYGCSPKELVSWLKCIRLIRNLCAHNDNLIDFRLAMRPMKPKAFSGLIMHHNDGLSRHIAMPIFVLKYLMLSVDPNFNFNNIESVLYKLIHRNNSKAIKYNVSPNERAQKLGFINYKSINYLSINKKQYFRLMT